MCILCVFFFSSRRRHTRCSRDWSSDVCSSDLFVKYLEAIGIVGLLLHKFAGIKKSIKGVSVRNLFLQVLYFFFDGTSRHLSYFDELQREEGYQAVVEMPAKQMASSHAMKRFFRAFAIFHAGAFR